MGEVTLLADLPEGARVGLDSAPVIYLIEQAPRYLPLVEGLFYERLDTGLNHAVTSVVTLSEVLVKPTERGRSDLVERYRERLSGNPSLEVVEITRRIAEQAATLRATHRVRLPDAFQLAAAIEHGASHFITNDKRLKGVHEIRVLVLDDYLPD
jgi:predicted nucleic acid-binding protein